MAALASPRPRFDSWLSLIGETAGVGGCGVVHVSFTAPHSEGESRVLIQVQDSSGAVLGATSWSGGGRDLAKGSSLDVGYCEDGHGAVRVVAWVEGDGAPEEPFAAVPASWAGEASLDPRGVHLTLSAGVRSAA
jgi:hypothetical protein